MHAREWLQLKQRLLTRIAHITHTNVHPALAHTNKRISNALSMEYDDDDHIGWHTFADHPGDAKKCHRHHIISHQR